MSSYKNECNSGIYLDHSISNLKEILSIISSKVPNWIGFSRTAYTPIVSANLTKAFVLNAVNIMNLGKKIFNFGFDIYISLIIYLTS